MGELAAHTGEFPKAYTIDELGLAFDRARWLLSGPNHLTGNDLDISETYSHYGVDKIATALLHPGVTEGAVAYAAENAKVWAQAPAEIPVAGLGVLEKVGFGEQRICYKFTDGSNGKSMAVLFGSYDHNLGIQLPGDGRFTQTASSTFGNPRWMYSDLSTYVVLPVGNELGVTFQEFGGSPEPTGASAFVQGAVKKWAHRSALRAIDRQKNNIRPDLTRRDLRKPGHLLYKPGRLMPAVNNILVVEARKPGEGDV